MVIVMSKHASKQASQARGTSKKSEWCRCELMMMVMMCVVLGFLGDVAV